MAEQLLKIWERAEQEGWRLIAPLQGEQRYNANLLNPTASIIYDSLTKKSCSIDEVVKQLCERYPETSGTEIDHDVKTIAFQMQDLGVYKMNTSELHNMRTRGDLIPGLHVMREVEIEDVTNQLAKCFSNDDNNSKANILYSILYISPDKLKPYIIRNLHFHSEQVMFVSTDNDGKVRGIISLYRPAARSCTKQIGLFSIFDDKPSKRIQMGIEVLKALEKVIMTFFAAHKLRFIIQDRTRDSNNSISDFKILCNWHELSQIITHCGYRNEAELVNEFGPGINAKYYCKVI